jgi:hypothetical protein
MVIFFIFLIFIRYLIFSNLFKLLLLNWLMNLFSKFSFKYWGLGIGDWGLGIGDWGLGPIPNPQSPSPIPNPHALENKMNIPNL